MDLGWSQFIVAFVDDAPTAIALDVPHDAVPQHEPQVRPVDCDMDYLVQWGNVEQYQPLRRLPSHDLGGYRPHSGIRRQVTGVRIDGLVAGNRVGGGDHSTIILQDMDRLDAMNVRRKRTTARQHQGSAAGEVG